MNNTDTWLVQIKNTKGIIPETINRMKDYLKQGLSGYPLIVNVDDKMDVKIEILPNPVTMYSIAYHENGQIRKIIFKNGGKAAAMADVLSKLDDRANADNAVTSIISELDEIEKRNE